MDSLFHPIISNWFQDKVGVPTEPQMKSWPVIKQGRHTLVSAPTGTGKTFCAFLNCINDLFEKSVSSELKREVHTIYISPLKALSHDIEKNLNAPLEEIYAAAKEKGVEVSPIDVFVRTGDTPMGDRQKILKAPPHILVTTPESLYLMLTARKSRHILSTAKRVIVDEIHAIAGDKRGSHLALSLERLDRVCEHRLQRIGLSATQNPIDQIRDFLVGRENRQTRPCKVVEVGLQNKIDIGIEVPSTPLSSICSHEQWEQIYKKAATFIETHQTTLIFVNTRKMAERLSLVLRELVGEESVQCHHGSLSRQQRLLVETRLKEGRLKAVVATASLELGIDIGAVDLVLQIGSPRSIASFLQRLGRAGHNVHQTSKARIVALTRDELVEAAALIRSVKAGFLDKIQIPEKPFDILAQQIVAETAGSEEITGEELFKVFRQSFPYRNLEKSEFEKVLMVLDEGISSHNRSGRYIDFDERSDKLVPTKGARLAAITSGGAIPELAEYRVVTQEGTFVGNLDEEYAVESAAGDVFILGNHSWRVHRVRSGEVIVEDAHGETPNVPFWQGEAPGRTLELSQAVSELREEVEVLLSDEKLEKARVFIKNFPEEPSPDDDKVERQFLTTLFRSVITLLQTATLDRYQAFQVLKYLLSQKLALGVIPSQNKIVFERFFDMTGAMHLIVHAPFGQRITKAWGFAMRKSYCRSFDFELQAAADDNGFGLALGAQDSFQIESIFKMVNENNAYGLLEQAILQVPLFQVRWRWNLNRSLAVLRFQGGKKVIPHLQRYKSDDLLTAAFPAKTMCFEHITGDIELPDHPYVKQTMTDCMTEAMDYERWHQIIQKVSRGEIEMIAKDVREPSPFSHEIIHAQPYAFLDEAPLEERRTRAVFTDRRIDLAKVAHLEVLSPDAVRGVARSVRPKWNGKDELKSELKQLGVYRFDRAMENVNWVYDLEKEDVLKIVRDDSTQTDFLVFYRFEELCDLVRDHDTPIDSEEQRDLIKKVIRAHLERSGPVTVNDLSARAGLAEKLIQGALVKLETEGVVLRGRFTQKDVEQWCDKTNLSRIHKLSIRGLRDQIEPMSKEDYIDFLVAEHCVDHRDKAKQHDFAVAQQLLEGYEAPGSAWETELFADRISHFTKNELDQKTLSGQIVWLRAPSLKTISRKNVQKLHGRTPLVFCRRDKLHHVFASLEKYEEADLESLSPAEQHVVQILKAKGDLFFEDLMSACGLLRSECLDTLSRLLNRGLIMADGFSAFRELSKKRSSQQSYREKLKSKMTDSSSENLPCGRLSLTPLFRRKDIPQQEVLDFWCDLLLRRYRILNREVLKRESLAPKWSALQPVLRKRELEGKIRGGHFIRGISGSQYCEPAVYEKLKLFQTNKQEWHVISAADPCNLFGIITDGDVIPSLRHTKIIVSKGRPLAIYQSGEIEYLEDFTHTTREIFARALRLTGNIRRVDPFLKGDDKPQHVHKFSAKSSDYKGILARL